MLYYNIIYFCNVITSQINLSQNTKPLINNKYFSAPKQKRPNPKGFSRFIEQKINVKFLLTFQFFAYFKAVINVSSDTYELFLPYTSQC